MEVSKKRKHDVDCPRITYDATTKVFDRLFKEESLEDMKDVVRKKLGLSSSLPVHLSQMRDGKSVVLEDDDDFDAFYAFVHSTPVAKINVHVGDGQPLPAGMVGPDADPTQPMQLLELPTVHHAAADGHSLSKKRKVDFVEPVSKPLGDDVGGLSEIQQELAFDNSSQPSPNYEAPSEVPPTINVISVDSEEVLEAGNDTMRKKRNKVKIKRTQSQAANSTLAIRSLGEQAQSEVIVEASGSNSKESSTKAKGHDDVSGNTPYDAIKSKKRPRTSTAADSVQPVAEVLDDNAAPGIENTEEYSRSSKKSKHNHKDLETTDLTDDSHEDTRTKGPEMSKHHTPSSGQAEPSEVDILTWPPKEIKVSRKEREVVEPASTPGHENISKGKTKNPGPTQSLNPKPTLNETESGKETKSSALAGKKIKTVTKKSRKKEAPIVPAEVSSTAQDQAVSSDVMAATRAAVDAILARSSLSSKGTRETSIHSSPLVDVTASSPPAILIAPVNSSSSPDDRPELSNNASTTVEQPKTVPKCSVCDQTPSHIRSRCPVIKAGIRSMRQRIVELRRDTPQGNDEEREKVIEELQRIIDKRTKRNKTPAAEYKSANVKSTADQPIISPPLAADSTPVPQLSKTSKAVKSVEAPSQETTNTPSRNLAESLAFGDVSSFTEQDLEALIRGPNVSLADVPSSDSSEEDDDDEVMEEEPPEKLSLSEGRIRYPSSSDSDEEDEDEEASSFVPSIIPLPIKFVSELSNEDESSRSEDFQDDGDITSFHEINGLGSFLEVDKSGDFAVDDAYAADFVHLSGLELPENRHKVANDGHILGALDDCQVLDESEPKTMSDVVEPPVVIASSQSDPIEAPEKADSPQSPIEEDIHPLQSTPKAEVAVRTRSQRNTLVQKTTDATPRNVCQTGANGVNGNSKSTKKRGGLIRITDLPIPTNPAVRVIRPAGVQTRGQAARAEEGEEKADEEATDVSHARQPNGRLSASKTPSKTPKTPAKVVKTPAKTPSKAPVPSNGENTKSKSVTVVQNVLEAMESAPSEQSLASWAVLQGNSQAENETPGMVDELHSSPDMPEFPRSAREPVSTTVVNGVSWGPDPLDPLFLRSSSQQSFPYSQYPNPVQEPPGSEDEEDEVEATVVKPQTATRNSSRFRSLTEIASQPTLFTPTLRFDQTINAKEDLTNLYGRARKASEEESEDSDTESDSSETGTKAQPSHIPMSRRAGTFNSKRG